MAEKRKWKYLIFDSNNMSVHGSDDEEAVEELRRSEDLIVVALDEDGAVAFGAEEEREEIEIEEM